jgi:hypothetical protein
MKRSIIFSLVLLALAALLSFSPDNALAEDGKSASLCSFRIDVSQTCGGARVQAGATVVVTYFDGSQQTAITDGNGQAFFNCWGPTVSAVITYGGKCAFLCTTNYSNGSTFQVCLADGCSNPCPDM